MRSEAKNIRILRRSVEDALSYRRNLAVMFSETHGYNKTPAWISEVCKGAYVVILTVTTYDTTLVHREDLV